MILRYIKHQKIDPQVFVADHKIKYEKPTLFCGFPEKTFLMLTGDYKPEKYLYVDKIPKEVEIIRVYVPNYRGESGVICYSPNTVKIDLHIPSEIENPAIVKKAIFASIIKSLGFVGLDVKVDNNDLLIFRDGFYKKFCGSFYTTLKNNDYHASPVSFAFDYELMQNIYRLDTQKMKEKGNIKNMKDVVIGIDEIRAGIDRNLFLDNFARNITKRFGWELKNEDFTEAEKEQLWMI